MKFIDPCKTCLVKVMCNKTCDIKNDNIQTVEDTIAFIPVVGVLGAFIYFLVSSIMLL